MLRRTNSLLIALVVLFTAGVCLAEPTAKLPSNGAERWGANYFPNVVLTSHTGEKLRFFDDCIKGKVVAVNFIYTTCPDACPLETARMTEVQQILGDRVGKDVFFYSITIDPEIDTPEVLADYAQRYRVGPGWTFLTGREADITLLRKKFGLYIDEIQAEDSKDHNISLMIGNQTTGRWMKRSPFENAHVLAQQIGGWLHNWQLITDEEHDYSNAPKLRTPEAGESIFRTRCESCHTIGGGDVARSAQLVGPDLLAVTERRDREWLARWIAEPDVMLEEKDPIATALYEQFNRVAMPNMRLSRGDVFAVMEYLEKETEFVLEQRAEEERKAAVAAAVAEAKASAPEGGGCCAKGGAKDEAIPTVVETPAERPSGPSLRYAISLGGLLLMGVGLALRPRQSR